MDIGDIKGDVWCHGAYHHTLQTELPTVASWLADFIQCQACFTMSLINVERVLSEIGYTTNSTLSSNVLKYPPTQS